MQRMERKTTQIYYWHFSGHKMLQINSMPDHIHIFIGMRPHQSISALIQNVKTESSKWIKEQNLCSYPFAWQEACLPEVPEGRGMVLFRMPRAK